MSTIDSRHPLQKDDVQVAFALFGPFGTGVSLMTSYPTFSTWVFWAGVVFSLIGALGTYWIFWSNKLAYKGIPFAIATLELILPAIFIGKMFLYPVTRQDFIVKEENIANAILSINIDNAGDRIGKIFDVGHSSVTIFKHATVIFVNVGPLYSQSPKLVILKDLSNCIVRDDPYPDQDSNDFNDDILRKKLNLSHDVRPPLGGVARLALDEPSKWTWLGSRLSYRSFGYGKVFAQNFEKGTVYGPFNVGNPNPVFFSVSQNQCQRTDSREDILSPPDDIRE